jgi:hypothetical protein
MSTPPPAAGRPTVDDVALLLRARTKDSNGNEVGTFDDDTRPTGDQVDSHIDVAMALVGIRFGPVEDMPAEAQAAFAGLVAYRAALRVEKSYFPDQVLTGRSAYAELREEYLDDLTAFTEAMAGGGAQGAYPVYDYAVLPVGSWTSMPGSFIFATDPELLWPAPVAF